MEKETVTIVRPNTAFNYGYIIIALSFIAMFASMGIRGSFGTYVTGWEQTFSVNRVWVSIVSFTSLVIYGISIIIAGKLTDKIGPRKVLTISMVLISICLLGSFFATNIWHIMLLYGLIGSIGFGFASNVTVSVAIVKWFKEKKGFMISIVVVGMAAGPMIFGPLNMYLMEQMGWKSTFSLYGFIFVLLFIPLFALFYRDSPKQDASIEKKETVVHRNLKEKGSTYSILSFPLTWVLIIVYSICGFTDVGLIYTHFVPFGENRAYSSGMISQALLIYGISNIVGTLTVGYFTDKFSNGKLLAFLYGLRLVSLIMIVFLHDPMWLLIFALFYGFTDIATITPFTMMCANLFGEKNMGTAFGMISFFHQIGAAVGAFVPGLLFTFTANYQSTLWLSALLLTLNVLVFMKVKEQKKIIV